eukprot:1701095-Pleurochrysis_carterae.AAC.1
MQPHTTLMYACVPSQNVLPDCLLLGPAPGCPPPTATSRVSVAKLRCVCPALGRSTALTPGSLRHHAAHVRRFSVA